MSFERAPQRHEREQFPHLPEQFGSEFDRLIADLEGPHQREVRAEIETARVMGGREDNWTGARSRIESSHYFNEAPEARAALLALIDRVVSAHETGEAPVVSRDRAAHEDAEEEALPHEAAFKYWEEREQAFREAVAHAASFADLKEVIGNYAVDVKSDRGVNPSLFTVDPGTGQVRTLGINAVLNEIDQIAERVRTGDMRGAFRSQYMLPGYRSDDELGYLEAKIGELVAGT